MIHLLLGRAPAQYSRGALCADRQYRPTLSAGDVGIGINSDAIVACAPGSGATWEDITAGLLCTELPWPRRGVSVFGHRHQWRDSAGQCRLDGSVRVLGGAGI